MPGPFDGYVTKVAGGWEAAAAGVVIDVFAEQDDAADAVRERAGDAPAWLVFEDGEARPL